MMYIALQLSIASFVARTVVPSGDYFLLMETGDTLLLETGDKILLE